MADVIWYDSNCTDWRMNRHPWRWTRERESMIKQDTMKNVWFRMQLHMIMHDWRFDQAHMNDHNYDKDDSMIHGPTRPWRHEIVCVNENNCRMNHARMEVERTKTSHTINWMKRKGKARVVDRLWFGGREQDRERKRILKLKVWIWKTNCIVVRIPHRVRFMSIGNRTGG